MISLSWDNILCTLVQQYLRLGEAWQLYFWRR